MAETPSDPDFHEPFVRALTKYERIVRAYIRGSGISRPQDVDEIMQEGSLVAWEKFDQLLNFRRRHSRDRLVLNENVFELLLEESLEESSLNEKRLNHLQQCLAKLPEKSRQLVLTAYQPDSTIETLASTMGRKANALYQQLWRLRRTLELCVEEALNNESEFPPQRT